MFSTRIVCEMPETDLIIVVHAVITEYLFTVKTSVV